MPQGPMTICAQAGFAWLIIPLTKRQEFPFLLDLANKLISARGDFNPAYLRTALIMGFSFGSDSLTVFHVIFKSTPKYSCITRFRIPFILFQGTPGCLFVNFFGRLVVASPIISIFLYLGYAFKDVLNVEAWRAFRHKPLV